ncbi:MAG: type III pantothenate kinase [Lachnospiraceae bacterium]|nr:type III pantothenate kinase [Lachnospiraceae bacterium]
MIFAIDIGNTNIVLGCIQDRKILFTERLSTDHSKTDLEHAISIKTVLELHQINPRDIEGAIIGSVVPPLTGLFREALRKITGRNALVVGPGIKTGLNILMDNPAQIGSDLIAAAVAGIAEYPVPQIIIDMGTATTISVIDQHKNFIGGMILPGLRVSLDSLTSRTSQLPRISLDPPKRLIGKNTVESMKSGILYGNASCIDGMICRIEADLGQKATVIATGGLCKSIAPLCTREILLDDALLLKGLLLLYEKNIA